MENLLTDLIKGLEQGVRSSHVILPIEEYIRVLNAAKETERVREAAEKMQDRVRKVSKSLGLFLSAVNRKIPLDGYFSSFNEAQDEITLYVEGSYVRLKLNADRPTQAEDGEDKSQLSEEVSSTV